MEQNHSISIVLPCLNEAENLEQLLTKIKSLHPKAEIIVVNDGSTDNSEAICRTCGVNVISHPKRLGNGASIKTGARNATGEIIVFMDADGQHKPEDIQRLLDKIDDGYEMAVGARSLETHSSKKRELGNRIFNKLASFMTGQKIEDLTCGFRAVKAKHFKKFLYLLPNGFSYPTTSTMAFFRSALPITYIPIQAGVREGKSKIKLLQDGIRFFIIILKIGALYSPMRLFLPISFVLFIVGVAHYIYTYINYNSFTNMGAMLFMSSLFVFLMGILSEQISSLHYRQTDKNQ